MPDPMTGHEGALAVIHDFIRMQSEAIGLLERFLDVPARITAFDWASLRNTAMKTHQLHEVFDIFRPHGFGVEVRFRSLHIDFDFCRSGRPGGFDGWRLYNHTLHHPGRFIALDHAGFNRAIDELAAAGVLEHEENLHFLAEDRDRRAFPRLERMASGKDSILLQSCSYEDFTALAASWSSFVGGTLGGFIQAPDQSQYDLAIEGGRFWMAYDDWQAGISVEPRDDASARMLPMILARARRHARAGN